MNSTVMCTRSGATHIISVVIGLRLRAWRRMVDRHHQASSAQDTSHEMTTNSDIIPDRSSPGLSRTAPSVVVHQDGGEKYATDAQRVRARNNITIGTWNVRTLRTAGKLKELTHEMDRYRWAVLGLCEVRWKGFGEIITQEDHKFYFS